MEIHSRQHHMEAMRQLPIVFAGSVQSRFLLMKCNIVDHNWSRTNPNIAGTEHLGPVFCSPLNQKKVIHTNSFLYNSLQQCKLFVFQL
jgi:hypothetical protein